MNPLQRPRSTLASSNSNSKLNNNIINIERPATSIRSISPKRTFSPTRSLSPLYENSKLAFSYNINTTTNNNNNSSNITVSPTSALSKTSIKPLSAKILNRSSNTYPFDHNNLNNSISNNSSFNDLFRPTTSSLSYVRPSTVSTLPTPTLKKSNTSSSKNILKSNKINEYDKKFTVDDEISMFLEVYFS